MTLPPFPDREKSGSDTGLRMNTLVLPVAAKGFARIRFSPAAPRIQTVPPAEALQWLEEKIQQGMRIDRLEIRGPGDPLCEIDRTLDMLHGIGLHYPDIPLSLTTLGLNAEHCAASLSAAGVTHVTLLVDAVEPQVAATIFAWIRPGKKTLPLVQSTKLLIDAQSRAVKIFKEAGCSVTIKSTVYPGYNDKHIVKIAETMALCGADDMILTPCISATDEDEVGPVSPDSDTMQQLKVEAAKHLPVFLLEDMQDGRDGDFPVIGTAASNITPLPPKPAPSRLNVAVVSSNGMEVDIHLGQAQQVLIYGPREDGLPCLLGTRPIPAPGSGSERWEELAATLHDCFAILTAGAGESPRKILGRQNISILVMEDQIEGCVDSLYGGGKKRKTGKIK